MLSQDMHYMSSMLSQLTILFYRKAMMTELSVVLEMFSTCAGYWL